MAITRIETDSNYFSEDGLPGTFTETQMEQDIVRYWGSEANERLFHLPYWKADRLMENSGSEQIAFVVSDIEDPNKVDARFESYNPLPEDTSELSFFEQVAAFFRSIFEWFVLLLTPDVDLAYFLLDSTYFPIGPPGSGNFKNFLPYHRLNIVGRIGRTESGLTVVFLVVGRITIINGPGAGGPGDISGAKIPPG